MSGKVLTDHARDVVSFANRRAGQKNGRALLEDILLGIANSTGIASQFLERLGLNSQTIRRKIKETNLETKDGASEKKKVLKKATDWSDRLRHRRVSTEHMLLAILELNEENKTDVLCTSTAFGMIREAGATVQKFMDDTGFNKSS